MLVVNLKLVLTLKAITYLFFCILFYFFCKRHIFNVSRQKKYKITTFHIMGVFFSFEMAEAPQTKLSVKINLKVEKKFRGILLTSYGLFTTVELHMSKTMLRQLHKVTLRIYVAHQIPQCGKNTLRAITTHIAMHHDK